MPVSPVPSPSGSLHPGPSPNIRNLIFQTALAGVVNGGIAAFLPVFLVRLGAGTVAVSLLTALPAVVTILLSLPSGAIVARQRRLVRSSAISYLLLRICYLLVALVAAAEPSLAAVLIVAIWGLSAVPSTIANTAWYSVLAEAVPPRRRPVVNGVRWALLGLVSALTVAAFGRLLDSLPFPLNYQIVFLISFVAGLLNVYFYSRLEIPDREPAVPETQRPALRTQVAELLRPLTEGGTFLTFCITTTVLRVGLFLPVGLYSVYWVNNLAATDTLIGLRTTIGNVALMLGYYFWGRQASARGHERVLVITALGLGFYPLLTGLADRPELLLPAALIWGIFASGIDVSLFEGLILVTPDDRRPRFVAVNTALANIVAFAAPIVGAITRSPSGRPAPGPGGCGARSGRPGGGRCGSARDLVRRRETSPVAAHPRP